MSHLYTQVFNDYTPNDLKILGDTNDLKLSFEHSGLLVCGESHGVKENADIVYTLCKLLGIKQIAIERGQTNFKEFVQTAIDGKPNFLLPMVMQSVQASVLSVEMLKVIVTLRNEGVITDIQYVDIDSSIGRRHKSDNIGSFMALREREIAANIIKYVNQPALVVLGSYHTRLLTEGGEPKSALQLLRQQRSVTYLRYRYLSGIQYNSGRVLKFKNLPPSDPKNKGHAAIYKESKHDYILELPKASMISA